MIDLSEVVRRLYFLCALARNNFFLICFCHALVAIVLALSALRAFAPLLLCALEQHQFLSGLLCLALALRLFDFSSVELVCSAHSLETFLSRYLRSTSALALTCYCALVVLPCACPSALASYSCSGSQVGPCTAVLCFLELVSSFVKSSKFSMMYRSSCIAGSCLFLRLSESCRALLPILFLSTIFIAIVIIVR